MENVLVIGGAGFIGSSLVDTLLDKNYSVKVLDNFSSGSMKNLNHISDRIEIIRGDVLDRDLLNKEVKGMDYVVDLAGMGDLAKSVSNPLPYHDVNLTGLINTLFYSEKNNVKNVVYSSSGSVYLDKPGAVSEDEALCPASPYAASKMNSEIYMRVFRKTYNMKTTTLRFFNVYGIRRENSAYWGAVTLFMSSMFRKKPINIYGDGNDVRDYIYVKDVARAVYMAIKNGASGEYNIGTGKGTSTNELAEKIENLFEYKVEIDHKPKRSGDTPSRIANTDKAYREFGFKYEYELDTGLKDLKDYLSNVFK
ncbi:MAG: NAD-dependent epimerase/dehydratase family protein [Thermoplasmata archaeon]